MLKLVPQALLGWGSGSWMGEPSGKRVLLEVNVPITQALDAPVSCARVQPTVPFPSGPSGTRLASLPALGREQPVSDDQRVSVPSHPDLGASALHWEWGAEEGVFGRRGWFGREDGVALWLSVAAGWL